MKSALPICAFVVLACLLSAGKAEDEFEPNCNLVQGDLSLHYKICGKITCNPDGSHTAIGCGSYQCSADRPAIGYKETDMSKAYPECCGGPICPK